MVRCASVIVRASGPGFRLSDFGAGGSGVGGGPSDVSEPPKSSTSWVKSPELRVTDRTASTSARFFAILSSVLTSVQTSSFGTRPTFWSQISVSLSAYFAPQPPFFRKQIQPPPYSSLPRMIVGCWQIGQTRSAVRQRYRASCELHEPNPQPTVRAVRFETRSHRTS